MVEAAGNLFTRIWENKYVKEAVLFVAGVFIAQLVLTGGDLLDTLKTAHSWTDLWTGFSGWFNAFSLAFHFKLANQAIAWLIAHAGGLTLGHSPKN